MNFIKLSIIMGLAVSASAFAQYPYPEQYPRPEYQQYQPAPQAIQPHMFTDYAKIIRVTPEYQQMNQPRQVCNNVEYMEQIPQGRNYGGAAIGGVTGALLGSQIGGGNGRNAATAAGAVVGALTGDNLTNQGYAPQYQRRIEQQCQTINNYHKELTGYRVEYEYRGQRQSFISATQPVGNKLRLNLQATPEINY